MYTFHGVQNVYFQGQSQNIQNDPHPQGSRNINSFNRSETVITDSFNNGDKYESENRSRPPQRSKTSAPPSNSRILGSDRGSRVQYRDEYDEGGYGPYPPNPHHLPHRSYTSPEPQPPRQPTSRYSSRQNSGQRRPTREHQLEAQPIDADTHGLPHQRKQYRSDTSNYDRNPSHSQRRPTQEYQHEAQPVDAGTHWLPRTRKQHRADTCDFDTIDDDDDDDEAYPQSPPAPTRGQVKPVQQRIYHEEPAPEPTLSVNPQATSKNPFLRHLGTDSEPSLTNAMNGLGIAESLTRRRGEPPILAPEVSSPVQTRSTSSGSSMYTYDLAHKDTPRSPNQVPETNILDDHAAKAIAYLITAVISNPTSYRKLLHIDRSKAQRLVDISQAVLENPRIDVKSRRELVVSMQRFSKAAIVYPRSYMLEGVRKMGLACTGQGAFGTVHRGVYQGRNVCLKALKDDGHTTPMQLSKAVAREAILWRQLNHRNLLPFYGICKLEIGLCLVSPWMRQGDLREYIRGPVGSKERLLVARDVAEGLEYLHSYDIVHGDLKGANVLIDGVGRARIADFGLTSINDPDIAFWTSQSKAASKGGTAAFQAPEILAAADDTENSKAGDMYTWGCVCYELYVGEEPYKGSARHITYQKFSRVMPTRPDEDSPAWKKYGLTEKMWSLMWKSWDAQPGLRPDASEAVKRLSEMIDIDHRPLEEDEEELDAKFINRWCSSPTNDDLATSGMYPKFKIPTVQQVQELLKLR